MDLNIHNTLCRNDGPCGKVVLRNNYNAFDLKMNYKRCYDPKLNSQCKVVMKKVDGNLSIMKTSNKVRTAFQEKLGKLNKNKTNLKYSLRSTDNNTATFIESNTELNKHTESSNISTTSISPNKFQINDGIINTANSKLLYCDSKLHLQCIIPIEQFDIDTKSNKHIKSGNLNTTIMSSKGLLNSEGILSITTDFTLLCRDPKLNLQCVVLIEKFNISTELNKHVQCSNKYTPAISKGLQNNDGMLSTTANWTLLCHDPKLNLQCVILIEKFDTSANILKVKSLNNCPNKISIRQKRTRKYNSNGNKTNWKNCLICTNERTKTDHKVPYKISRNYVSTGPTNELHIAQKNILLTHTNNKNKSFTKVKIKTHINLFINQSTSLKYSRKQMKKKPTELLNKTNEVALNDYILNKKVPIYKVQEIGNNKSKKSIIDLYEFDEFDTDKIKIHRNRQCNFNRSVYMLQKLDKRKTKLKVKNKKKRNIGTLSRAYKYNETMQEIIQNIMRKVYIKNNSVNQDHNRMVIGEKNILEHDIPTSDINSTYIENNDSENSNEEFFNFNDNIHSTPSKINPNININVTQNDCTNLFNNTTPSANSAVLSSSKYSPWRFSENVKRNPHFITIKKTALPCLQQDMVLDYVQLRNIEEHFSKTKKKIEKTKPVQKSILDFVDVSSYNISDQENIPHSNTCSTLFDYDDFSPIKIISQNFSKNKTKRNILTPKQDNGKSVQVGAISTQNKPISNYKSLIGFDNNKIILCAAKNKSSLARKCTSSNREVNRNIKCTKEITPIEMSALDLDESISNQLVMFSNKEGELFEDTEQVISLNMPSRIYESKRGKRRLLSEILDEDESKPKKKNMMTKEEEAELEKRAAHFNGKCEEIEPYRLDIE